MLEELGFSAGIDSAGKYLAVASCQAGIPEPYTGYLSEQGLLQAHLDDYERRPFPAPVSTDPRCYMNTDPTPIPDYAYCDNWIARSALALIDSAPGGQPWFLQVNFTGPHDPMDVTVSMSERVHDRTLPSPIANDQLPPSQHLQIRRNYAAMIENIDSRCGEILDSLARRGALANTVVIYSSDHGEMLGDLGHWAKVIPYEPSLSVPMVIAGPGLASGQRAAFPVSHVDLTATILEMAGASPEGPLDGFSLVPVLRGDLKSFDRDLVHAGLGTWRATSDSRYKYIRGYIPGSSMAEITTGSYSATDDLPELLFDIEEDPHELHDLSRSAPRALKTMRDALLGAGR